MIPPATRSQAYGGHEPGRLLPTPPGALTSRLTVVGLAYCVHEALAVDDEVAGECALGRGDRSPHS
jgi:hypothetical protein